MGFVVAIDGPAGTGKGTIAKLISEELGLINIDTGAMYRSVSLCALENNIKDTEPERVEEMLKTIDMKFVMKDKNVIILLNGKDVSKEIREQRINECVAKYAALKCVRDKLTKLQQEMGKTENIVMEGRDIGTTVFPNADVKIYLDCSIEERANRRYKQELEKGIDTTYEEVLESIKQRHILETEREISPLRKADDAILIDTTNLTIPEEMEIILGIIREKMNA